MYKSGQYDFFSYFGCKKYSSKDEHLPFPLRKSTFFNFSIKLGQEFLFSRTKNECIESNHNLSLYEEIFNADSTIETPM